MYIGRLDLILSPPVASRLLNCYSRDQTMLEPSLPKRALVLGLRGYALGQLKICLNVNPCGGGKNKVQMLLGTRSLHGMFLIWIGQYAQEG